MSIFNKKREHKAKKNSHIDIETLKGRKKRMSVEELTDIVEKVISDISPELLEALKVKYTNTQDYTMTLMGTPYWFCAQYLDKYMVESFDTVEKLNTDGEMMVQNIMYMESLIEERFDYDDTARDQIKDIIKNKLPERKPSGNIDFFVNVCLAGLQYYMALHNELDPDPDENQIITNIGYFDNVIKYYFQAIG